MWSGRHGDSVRSVQLRGARLRRLRVKPVVVDWGLAVAVTAATQLGISARPTPRTTGRRPPRWRPPSPSRSPSAAGTRCWWVLGCRRSRPSTTCSGTRARSAIPSQLFSPSTPWRSGPTTTLRDRHGSGRGHQPHRHGGDGWGHVQRCSVPDRGGRDHALDPPCGRRSRAPGQHG